jgi:hypothetical protein
MERGVIVAVGAQVFLWPRHVQVVLLLRHWSLQRSQAEVQLVTQKAVDLRTVLTDSTAFQQSDSLGLVLLLLLFLGFVEANNCAGPADFDIGVTNGRPNAESQNTGDWR